MAETLLARASEILARLRRDVEVARNWFLVRYTEPRFRLIVRIFGGALLAYLLIWAVFARKGRGSLPDKTKAAGRPWPPLQTTPSDAGLTM